MDTVAQNIERAEAAVVDSMARGCRGLVLDASVRTCAI